MVGAVILFGIALLTGASGLYLWVSGGSDAETLRGLVLCLIGAVALSGALIIDGLRFYAGIVSKQIDWMVKRMNYRPSMDIEPSATASLAGKNMMRYQVIGIDQQTGLQTELMVQATDQTSALRTGEKAGMEVKRVQKVS